MNIGIVGLGLIGGSMAKTIRAHSLHKIFATDRDKEVLLNAKVFGCVDEELTPETLPFCDMVLVALYPSITVEYLKNNAAYIKKNTMVIDCCGVKKFVCEPAWQLAENYGFTFIGGHPMAGIERSGFYFSKDTMFQNASMILTPKPDIEKEVLEEAEQFFLSIGFGRIRLSTPEEHDTVIAYTSQLAHVLSSAYIKSPAAQMHSGFSAGSFKDMTRVATLNEQMWTELFFCNKAPLIHEIDTLAERLLEYSDALKQNDRARLTQLLHDGCVRKAQSDALK